MHAFIEDICNEIGPRESGKKEEKLAGNKIEEEMKNFCDETHQEEYISSPTAFLGFVRYGASLFIISIILYWLSFSVDNGWLLLGPEFSIIFSVISLSLTGFAIFYFIAEVMRYYEVVDFLFPKKKSKNVIGVINPKEEIRQTIIFSGHHDSAYEFNTFYYLKTFGAVIIFLGYFGVLLFFIVNLLKFMFFFTNIDLNQLFLVFGIIFLCFIPIAVFYLFFHSYKPVPGAFDNLSAVSIVLGIGKYLSENRNGAVFPNHTRVLLVSFAGEEAGLRGAKRYVKKHIKELHKNTVVLNMDGIANKDNILITKNESLIGAKHDKTINEKLLKIANDLNIKAKLGAIPFGATDAAAFSLKKIRATNISAFKFGFHLPYFYHTRFDTPDVVEKESLGQVMQICLEFLKDFDKSS